MKSNELKLHIKNKKIALEELAVNPEIIAKIPWDSFKSIVQVDNYCRPIIMEIYST